MKKRYGSNDSLKFAEALAKRLHDKNINVWGCDISKDLVAERKEKYGHKFFHANEWPNTKFDAIVAVEVFEHFFSPMKIFNLFGKHLNKNGIIAGTTDFYDGGNISDHFYIKSNLHISYWSKKSISFASAMIGRRTALFKLECPGSVYPDEKFGILWPRKRVFFIYPESLNEYFDSLSARYKILPINKP